MDTNTEDKPNTDDAGGNAQTMFGPAGLKALDAEREAQKRLKAQIKDFEAKIAELEPKAAKADEFEAGQKTELEKLTARAEQAEAREGAAAEKLLRLDIAAEKGISEFAQFLSGSTAEEIAESADELLKKLPGSTRPVAKTLRSGAAPDTDGNETPGDPDAWMRNRVQALSGRR